MEPLSSKSASDEDSDDDNGRFVMIRGKRIRITACARCRTAFPEGLLEPGSQLCRECEETTKQEMNEGRKAKRRQRERKKEYRREKRAQRRQYERMVTGKGM